MFLNCKWNTHYTFRTVESCLVCSLHRSIAKGKRYFKEELLWRHVSNALDNCRYCGVRWKAGASWTAYMWNVWIGARGIIKRPHLSRYSAKMLDSQLVIFFLKEEPCQQTDPTYRWLTPRFKSLENDASFGAGIHILHFETTFVSFRCKLTDARCRPPIVAQLAPDLQKLVYINFLLFNISRKCV